MSLLIQEKRFRAELRENRDIEILKVLHVSLTEDLCINSKLLIIKIVSRLAKDSKNVQKKLESLNFEYQTDPNGEKRIVQITKLNSNGGGETMLVNVDDEAGIKKPEEDPEWQAAYGDLPPLGDQEPDTDGFQ